MPAARSAKPRRRGRPVGRIAVIAGLVLIAALYVGPVEKYLRVQRELRQERAIVGRLQNVHDVLGVRVTALHTKPAIVQCARARGWVFPGEKTVIVTGIPPQGNELAC
jgi:hypothetical protein